MARRKSCLSSRERAAVMRSSLHHARARTQLLQYHAPMQPSQHHAPIPSPQRHAPTQPSHYRAPSALMVPPVPVQDPDVCRDGTTPSESSTLPRCTSATSRKRSSSVFDFPPISPKRINTMPFLETVVGSSDGDDDEPLMDRRAAPRRVMEACKPQDAEDLESVQRSNTSLQRRSFNTAFEEDRLPRQQHKSTDSPLSSLTLSAIPALGLDVRRLSSASSSWSSVVSTDIPPTPAKKRSASDFRRPETVGQPWSCSDRKWRILLSSRFKSSITMTELIRRDSVGSMFETDRGIDAAEPCSHCIRTGRSCRVANDPSIKTKKCAACRWSHKQCVFGDKQEEPSNLKKPETTALLGNVDSVRPSSTSTLSSMSLGDSVTGSLSHTSISQNSETVGAQETMRSQTLRIAELEGLLTAERTRAASRKKEFVRGSRRHKQAAERLAEDARQNLAEVEEEGMSFNHNRLLIRSLRQYKQAAERLVEDAVHHLQEVEEAEPVNGDTGCDG